MSLHSLSVKYDGGDANRHSIDAKLFGQSLQGIDRLVSDCILIFAYQRLPKRSERAPLVLKIKEPQQGSYAVDGVAQEVSTLLAVGVPIIQTIGPEIISHYISAVLDFFRGSDSAVEIAIQKMADMHEKSIAALSQSQKDALTTVDAMDQRRSAEYMALTDILRLAISSSGQAAVDYVAPLGKSVDSVSFRSGSADFVTVGVDDAETIRESQKLDWEGLKPVVLTTDGFRFHTKGLSVENPERDGFMMAEVDDPAFDEESNPYTLAAQKRGRIEVTARYGRKNGILAKIQIVEFKREFQ